MATADTTVDGASIGSSTVELPGPALALVAALAAGAAAQGGYYLAGRVLVTALAAVALGLALRARPWSRDDGWPLPAAAAALAAWALARGLSVGAVVPALAALAASACFAVPPLVLGRATPAQHARIALTAQAVGGLVAGTAWAGVAWRLPRFAVLVDGTLWRGAATLTYPNAAAALLVPLALLALSALVAAPRSPVRAATAYLLLVGTGAAASRAGLLALLAGLVVLAVLTPPRRALPAVVPPVLGAVAATVALAPSFPAVGAAHPTGALLGLGVGAVVAVGPGYLPGAARTVGIATLAGAAALVAVTRAGSLVPAAVVHSRASAVSAGRSGALHAAGELVRLHPFAGAGVEQARLFWVGADGNGQLARYAHNEYLQTLLDLGVLGCLLLAGVFAACVVMLRRGRRYPRPSGLRAGALAGLAALAVHSGFDFLWHMAVFPLAAGLLLGLAGPATREEPITPTEGTTECERHH